MDEKKLKRRTSKTRFTRQKRVLENQLKQEGPLEELTAELTKLELALTELQERHDDYCETIADTEAYEKEEEYIQGCIDEFDAVKICFKSVTKGLAQHQIPVDPLPEQSNQTPPVSIGLASPLPLASDG